MYEEFRRKRHRSSVGFIGTVIAIIAIGSVAIWLQIVRQKRDALLVQAVSLRDGAQIVSLINDGVDIETIDRSSEYRSGVVDQTCIRKLSLILGIVSPRDQTARLPLILQLVRPGGPASTRPIPCAALEALLKHGANPNACKGSADPPIFYLCKHQNLPLLTCLLRYGADVNVPNASGETPLFHSDAEATRLLLCYGARVNARDKAGMTPLMREAFTYDTTKCRLLIAAHASVNLADNEGNTILMYQTGYNHLSTAKLLLEKGAFANATDLHGRTALIQVCDQYCSADVARLLMSFGAKPDQKDLSGHSALYYARRRNNIDVLRTLLDVSRR